MSIVVKWYELERKQPKGKAPLLFVVGDQEIEGWYIYNWDRRCFQFVQENERGTWNHFKDEDIKKWRYFGASRLVIE